MSPETGAPPAAAAPNTYDAVPYSVNAFPQTHPDRLAVIARLMGLASALPQRCRVLELGCASGGNLMPMALVHPQSEFVGIDLSARQIAEGQQIVTELAIPNLQLKAASILDIDASWGKFDYILAHGVYSWVPPAVQDKILAIARENLSANGVAYVSYNTYPGWHARAAIREMLWYHTERFKEPRERIRQARGLLSFLAASVGDHGGGYSALIRQELTLLLRTPDTYLLHEHLEEFNEPLYFHQFAQRAADKGLQYLGEAQVSAMRADRFGPNAEYTLRHISPDNLHMEQYMDFLRNRMFRQTLLCHADISLDHALRPMALREFHIASPAKALSKAPNLAADKPEEFRSGAHTLTTQDPLMKAAMLHLGAIYPRSITLDELRAAAMQRLAELQIQPTPERSDASDALPTRLLNCYASLLLELSLCPPVFVTEISARPAVWPYARLRARLGDKITNMRLESVKLGESARLLVQTMDGGHDRASLIALLVDWIEKQPLPAAQAETPASTVAEVQGTSPSAASPPASGTPRERAEKYVDQLLVVLARSALLTG